MISFGGGTAVPIPFLLDGSSYWFGPQASTFAKDVDWLFNFILAVCAFFFVLIVGAAVYFVMKYRYREGVHEEPLPAPTHNTRLEIVWSVIPAVLVGVIFWYGFQTYVTLRTAPADCLEINVTAQKWAWDFQYPNGWSEPELHVPAGENVRLVMTSVDVLHSLWIPDFRTKMDCVQGRYSDIWFNAPEAGEHIIFCTEYCGTSHSRMLAKLVVHPNREAYEAWLANASNVTKNFPPVEAGQILFAKKGCATCHAVDAGGPAIGPSFVNLANHFGTSDKHQLQDKSFVTVDENYIRESILNPQAKIAAGANGNQMPTYQGRMKEEEISCIIAYIKSLKN